MLVLGRALLKGELFESVYLTFVYICFALYLCVMYGFCFIFVCHVWIDFVDLI